MGRSISSTTGKDQVKSVTSSAGFDSGDLIYQTASDIGKIPDDFVSTDNFDAKQKGIRSVQNSTSSFNRKITVPDDIKKKFMGHGCPSAILSNGNIVTVTISMVLFGLFNTLIMSAGMALSACLVEPKNRGKIAGGLNFVGYILTAMGMLIGNLLYNLLPQMPIYITIAIAIPMILIIFFRIPELRKEERKF